MDDENIIYYLVIFFMWQIIVGNLRRKKKNQNNYLRVKQIPEEKIILQLSSRTFSVISCSSP